MASDFAGATLEIDEAVKHNETTSRKFFIYVAARRGCSWQRIASTSQRDQFRCGAQMRQPRQNEMLVKPFPSGGSPYSDTTRRNCVLLETCDFYVPFTTPPTSP